MESHEALLASITGGPGETRTILDLATGAVVGEVPVHTVEYLDRAVAAAADAQPGWAALGHKAAAPYYSKRQTPSSAPRKTSAAAIA